MFFHNPAPSFMFPLSFFFAFHLVNTETFSLFNTMRIKKYMRDERD